MKADLTRSAERWAACSPESVASGSEAQMRVFVADAKADIATLLRRIAALEAEASEGERRGLERAAEIAVVNADYYDASAMREDLEDWEVFRQRESARAVRRVVAAIRALIPEAPARDGWQPIETAPKDGSEIILHDRGTVGTGFYSEAPEARRGEAGWFWEDDRGNLVIAKNADPTHWMPLPPPASQEREG